MTTDDLKKLATQKKVNRIKTKSTAKGDNSIPRDERFAILVELDPFLGQFAKMPLFVRRTQAVGLIIDTVCQRTGLELVENFDDLANTKL